MNIYTSENEMLKEELKAANAWIKASEKIIAEQDAKLKLALYRAVKTYHEGEPVYVAQPEQPKYRRGSRVICLETEEYCVIHISGTDRQWIKFPDSHIGVYTNEQVAELFELLPKEQPQPEQNLSCKSVQARLATAWGYVKAQSQQEPVAWIHNFIEGGISIGKRPADLERHPDRWTALYKDPKPCPTCEALARTVMLDQTSHDTTAAAGSAD